jgi:hypothetical protein
VTAKLPHCRRLLVAEGFGLSGSNPVGDFGRCGLAMVHAGKYSHCLCSLLAASHGHMGGFIGTENGNRMLQCFEFTAEVVDFLEGHSIPCLAIPDSKQELRGLQFPNECKLDWLFVSCLVAKSTSYNTGGQQQLFF